MIYNNILKIRLQAYLLSFFCIPILLQGQTPVTLGAGNSDNITITTSHTNGAYSPANTIDGQGFLANLEATSRFLGQATLGMSYDELVAASELSYTEWLDQQFATSGIFSIEQRTREITQMAVDSTYAMGGDPNDVAPRRWYWHTAWWEYTMESPDLLRNRVALALSEIFVISEKSILEDRPLALANYYDMLLHNAFGNFRDLLEDVTYHPAMGVYLTHMNNPKSDPLYFRFPDENYAREIMQLFTIGLYELNLDGTRQTDVDGNFIPTYDNVAIQEFSKVFTGFTWGDAFAFGQNPNSRFSYLTPMQVFDSWHESGPKYLLNNYIVPDRNPVDAAADISDALDNLFNHPNVGSFIAYRLIQRLVKSNPTPDYVARVATAFNDNGQGVRGDMMAVIKAVLLDEEARNCNAVTDPLGGMLREPMVRYAHVCRAFNANVGFGFYRNYMETFYQSTLQRPLASPSVFNFFQTDYQPLGVMEEANLVGPEFQITNTVTVSGYANMLHDWIYDEYPMQYWDFFSDEHFSEDKIVRLDLSPELIMGDEENLSNLIERLNLIFLHGNLSRASRNTIYETVSQLPAGTDFEIEMRAKLCIYLVLISPDYMIMN